MTDVVADTHAIVWAVADPTQLSGLPLVSADGKTRPLSLPGLTVVW